jgi:hypothetical protein
MSYDLPIDPDAKPFHKCTRCKERIAIYKVDPWTELCSVCWKQLTEGGYPWPVVVIF